MGKRKSFVNRNIKMNSVPSQFKRQNKKYLDETDNLEKAETSPKVQKPYMSAYKRAEMEYQRIQEQRRVENEQKLLERERRNQAMEEYQSIKKRMNKALLCKTKKGQPKLDAQINVLLEKIERRYKK